MRAARGSVVALAVAVLAACPGPQPTPSGECPPLSMPGVVTVDALHFLDLGGAMSGQTVAASFSLWTQRTGGETVTVRPVQPPTPDAGFDWAPGSPVGALALTPDAGVTLTVRYASSGQPFPDGAVVLERGEGCSPVTINLVVTPVQQLLSWAPTTVDFGTVDAGAEAVVSLTFENLGFQPVTLSGLQVSEPGATSARFHVDAGPAAQVVVPAASRADPRQALLPGRASVAVSYSPATGGLSHGLLKASTSLPEEASVAVPLKGTGKP